MEKNQTTIYRFVYQGKYGDDVGFYNSHESCINGAYRCLQEAKEGDEFDLPSNISTKEKERIMDNWWEITCDREDFMFHDESVPQQNLKLNPETGEFSTTEIECPECGTEFLSLNLRDFHEINSCPGCQNENYIIDY